MKKKRYWLKFHENFFNEEEIVYLESLENGEKYINVWLKLLLRCLKDGEENAGMLRFNEKIPYDDVLLSKVLRVDVDTVRVSLKYFSVYQIKEAIEIAYIKNVSDLVKYSFGILHNWRRRLNNEIYN